MSENLYHKVIFKYILPTYIPSEWNSFSNFDIVLDGNLSFIFKI
ncbi:hypothetical protein PJIAN_340 [Paludibacter jiangxiensis]|uniref:Uncharacterized protein n=1 Tax=Paludibacter jiangxiensis TaxID=681398 RepID=A0A161LEK3_9BACT|nr:hypothetical protein PJIAN_340 [Paludibacter jiangxiensis]